MKKFTILFLIIICFSLNIFRDTPVLADTVVKEGVHKVSNFDLLQNHVYTIENTSTNTSIYVFVFDKNQVIQQTIRLKPQPSKYNLIPLEPDYKIVLVGNGEVIIS